VTVSAAGVLVGRGLLDVNAPVTDYLPELNDTAYRGASLQHVLDMTSGVQFSEDYTDPYSDIGKCDVASGWKPIPPASDPAFRWPRHMFELILSLGTLDRRHGDLFSYRSIETDVMAFCMERVTGKRLPQIVSDEIWQPMGAEESACYTVDAAGYALADGGFNATLRDYGRLGLLYLENGGGIIPPAWVEATRTGNHAIFHEPYTHSLPEGAYRNQWWIEDPHSRSIMARGVFGQLIYVNWDQQMVAVKLSSWPDFLNTHYSVVTLKALHAIAGTLT
jgi:CubicO group peptidase (beta-lactamase class C family)